MCCHERVNDIRDLTKYRFVFYVAVYFGGIIKILDCGALHDVGNRFGSTLLTCKSHIYFDRAKKSELR